MTLSKAYNFIQVDELISSSGTLMHIDLQSLKHLNWSKERIFEFSSPIWKISGCPIWQNFVDKHTRQA